MEFKTVARVAAVVGGAVLRKGEEAEGGRPREVVLVVQVDLRAGSDGVDDDDSTTTPTL